MCCSRVNVLSAILETRGTYSSGQKLSSPVSSDVIGGDAAPRMARVVSNAADKWIW